jgi:hypothetical protein
MAPLLYDENVFTANLYAFLSELSWPRPLGERDPYIAESLSLPARESSNTSNYSKHALAVAGEYNDGADRKVVVCMMYDPMPVDESSLMRAGWNQSPTVKCETKGLRPWLLVAAEPSMSSAVASRSFSVISSSFLMFLLMLSGYLHHFQGVPSVKRVFMWMFTIATLEVTWMLGGRF